MGGKFHPKLNIITRPIAQKYREGKVKRTLKRGLKGLEIAKGEANASRHRTSRRYRELVNQDCTVRETCMSYQRGPRHVSPSAGRQRFPLRAICKLVNGHYHGIRLLLADDS